MTAGWIAYGLLACALVSTAAAGAEGVLRLAGRPGRWAWAGGMLVALALVAGAPMRTAPARAPVVVPQGTEVQADAAVPDRAGGGGLFRAARRAGLAAAARLQGVVDGVPAGVQRAFGVAWAGSSGLLLVLMAATHLRLRRARRRWAVAELVGERVLVAPDTGPAVVGWLRPVVVVPAWLLGLRRDEQRLVLEHEREHLRARDPLLLGLGCVAAALLPWHPASWWMLSRLRLAVEMDCDARVLHRGARADSYGMLLIDLAGRCSGPRVGAPALADSPSHLRRRLVAMTPKPIRFPVARAGAFASLAALSLAAACELRLPTTAEIEEMDVAGAEAATRALAGADDGSIYLVDGVEVTAAEARALAPGQIDHVAVHRSQEDGVASRIEILTHPAAPAAPPVPSAEPNPAAPPAPQREMDPALPPTPPRDVPPGRGRVGGAMPSFEGVVLIDGAPARPSDLRALAPERIESVEVIKGDAAMRLSSDPAARNGIIRVTTRR